MTARSGKLIGARPRDPAEHWIDTGQDSSTPASKTKTFSARLTIDVAPALRGRIKVAAFERGITVANMLRGLLEEQFGAPRDDAGKGTL